MMLELRNIYKNYTQGKLDVPVLKDISLTVAVSYTHLKAKGTAANTAHPWTQLE